MKLEIVNVMDKGVLDKERIALKALQSVNLKYYALCDTTFTDDGKVSNEWRHTYWFPSLEVAQGDWVVLQTADGKYSRGKHTDGSTVHYLHWQLDKTVWNKDGDCAVLFELTQSQAKKI